MPERDLALLTGAAEAAGRIALRYWRRAPEAWEKAGGAGPVTEADIAVNDMLEAELRAARPDYGWLSEESPDGPARLRAERVFIVDPIDGTRAFLEGQESFAHSLAVAEGGRVVAAAVCLPAAGLVFAAGADGPATLNGAPLKASRRTSAEGATVLTSRASLKPDHWRGDAPPPLKQAFRASLAYRICLVAQGRFDSMLTLRPTWEWDIAAGDLIAARAGAVLSDRLGGGVRYNAADPRVQGVVCAPPGLHGEIVGRLRPWPEA